MTYTYIKFSDEDLRQMKEFEADDQRVLDHLAKVTGEILEGQRGYATALQSYRREHYEAVNLIQAIYGRVLTLHTGLETLSNSEILASLQELMDWTNEYLRS